MGDRRPNTPNTSIVQQMRAAEARGIRPQERTTGWREAGAQFNAGLMGATDMIAFGKGKELQAAEFASQAVGGPAMVLIRHKEFREIYGMALRALEKQEAYDIQNRKAARRTGQAVGLAVTVVGGPEVTVARGLVGGARVATGVARAGRTGGSVAKAGQRARGSAPVLAGPGRLSTAPAAAANKVAGTTVIAGGGGAASGLGAEVVSQRLEDDFDARDLFAATVGGMVDGLATKAAGSSIGGAVGGAADAALRDGADTESVLQAMGSGGMFGRAGRFIGTEWSDSLNSNDKGDLGERMSLITALASGRKPEGPLVEMFLHPRTAPKAWASAGGKDSIPDFKFPDGSYLEAKFGRWAKVTPGQRALLNDPAQTMDLEHWFPIHVGNSLGAGLSAAGIPLVSFNEHAVSTPSPTDWFNPYAVRR